jgi:hypothetical protein
MRSASHCDASLRMRFVQHLELGLGDDLCDRTEELVFLELDGGGEARAAARSAPGGRSGSTPSVCAWPKRLYRGFADLGG